MASEWRQYNGGRRWRVLGTGEYEVEGHGVIRSKGRPLTMLYLIKEWGREIQVAADLAGVPREWVAAMVTIEAQRQNRRPLRRLWRQAWSYVGDRWRRAFGSRREMEKWNRLRFDPVSLRMEPGYVCPYTTPSRISASLSQVLLSTAREQMAREGGELTFRLGEVEIDMSDSPALIFDPQLCLICSALYMKWQVERYKGRGLEIDFVHMTGAYNAGSLLPDQSNPYGMVAFHKWRTDKALRYLNDSFDPEVLGAWP